MSRGSASRRSPRRAGRPFEPIGHEPADVIPSLHEQDLPPLAVYDEVRGYPPYDPQMMTALLLYGYSRGVYSSRRLARACEERLDFMAVTAQNRPDFRTIAITPRPRWTPRLR
jgi:hypothetical protein